MKINTQDEKMKEMRKTSDWKKIISEVPAKKKVVREKKYENGDKSWMR